MAVQYVTMDNLGKAMERYGNTVKLYTNEQIKAYIKAIAYDTETHMLKFYTVPAPVPAGTVPYLEVNIGEGGGGQEEYDELYTMSMEIPQVPDQGKFKTHIIYQGTGQHKTEIGRINLEYDTFVESGSVVTATPQNPIVIGGQTITDGKYLRLVIHNNSIPVYISLGDIGAVYAAGDGIQIDQNEEISIVIDSNNANGLAVGPNGLKLNLAVAPDSAHGIAGSAGAMSAQDKEILDSFSIATDAQIENLFN